MEIVSFDQVWEEEGPGEIVSQYMESDQTEEGLRDEEKSWVALAFAAEQWSEEAIEMASQIEEVSARGKCARALALRDLGQREEAVQAMRQSLEVRDHPGRKEILARWLLEDARQDGAGAFDPVESGKQTLYPNSPWAGTGTAYDYSHPRYNRPKELFWDSLEMGEPGSAIVRRASVQLAQLATSEEEAAEALRRGAEKGSLRARFELAAVRAYFSPESPEGFVQDAGEIHWPKAWEVYQEGSERGEGKEGETGIQEENEDIFGAYVEFAALAARQEEDALYANREYPDRFYDLGLRLMSQAGALEASREEIAVFCGRAAVLSGDLEIGAMFYEEATGASSVVGGTTAQIEEAALRLKLAEEESLVVAEESPTELLQNILQASERVLEEGSRDVKVAHLIGMRSRVVGYTTGISATNAPLLEEAVSRVNESDQFDPRSEGIVQAACAEVLSGPLGLVETEEERKWRAENLYEGALKCDHPEVSWARRSLAMAQGHYGEAIVESARSLAKRSESKEEVQNRAHSHFDKIRKNVLLRELEEEAPDIVADLPSSYQAVPHEQPPEKRKERFAESHQRIRAFVEGGGYLDEIKEAYRPPILEQTCLQWEALLKRGPFEETGEKMDEAAQAMLSAGAPKGAEEKQAVWVRGAVLRHDAMRIRGTSDRKAWAEQRSRLETARMIDSPLQAHAIAKYAQTCKALGDLDKAERALRRLGSEDKESVHLDVEELKSQIDSLKTARDRWPNLDYYPKKLLAALTAVDGEFSIKDLAQLSGQSQKYVGGNIQELFNEGMLASSPAVGPIWIEDIGGVRVNPHVEDLARRERSHEVKSRIIEADEDLKAKRVFDSDGEYKIYRTLTETFPNALVFPNMSPSAIFGYDEMQEALTSEEFQYFLQSRIDFCIVSTDSYLPVVGIEVDSHYHDQDEQKERDEKKDKIFRIGGIPLIRLRRYGSQSDEAVANQVRDKIQELVERDTEQAKVLRLANVEV